MNLLWKHLKNALQSFASGKYPNEEGQTKADIPSSSRDEAGRDAAEGAIESDIALIEESATAAAGSAAAGSGTSAESGAVSLAETILPKRPRHIVESPRSLVVIDFDTDSYTITRCILASL